MKKLKSPSQKILQNLRNLIPYIGALLVFAGIIGLLFIQKPLETSQDSRSDASETIAYNCAQSCNTNRDCAINLRCYQGECRLATNPTDPKCMEKTVVQETSTKSANTMATTEAKPTTQPQKGDDSIGSATEFEQQENALADRKDYDDSYQADETLLDLAKNLISNPESKLPFFIILFGILLLVISTLVGVLTKIKKNKSVVYSTKNHDQKINVQTHEVKPGVSTTQELIKTLENQPKD